MPCCPIMGSVHPSPSTMYTFLPYTLFLSIYSPTLVHTIHTFYRPRPSAAHRTAKNRTAEERLYRSSYLLLRPRHWRSRRLTPRKRDPRGAIDTLHDRCARAQTAQLVARLWDPIQMVNKKSSNCGTQRLNPSTASSSFNGAARKHAEPLGHLGTLPVQGARNVQNTCRNSERCTYEWWSDGKTSEPDKVPRKPFGGPRGV